VLPVPMMNILNGGAHADNNVDFQEFMVMPVERHRFPRRCAGCGSFSYAQGRAEKGERYNTSVGDEGGFAPSVKSNVEAIEVVLEAIHRRAYKPGKDIGIGARSGSQRVLSGWKYVFKKSDKSAKSSEDIDSLLCEMGERLSDCVARGWAVGERLEGWALLTKELGGKIQLVPTTSSSPNIEIFRQGIEKGIANSILIKLNQIGTVQRDAGRNRSSDAAMDTRR